MADKWLLETGPPDAWQIEDASGVWILEETAASPPLDDGESWWAGAKHCFVGVAIAGTAAALATSVAIAGTFKQQDELPTPVQATADSGSIASNQRKAETTSFRRWYAQDELPSHAFEDDSWAARAPGKTVPAALTIWASDELGTPAATFVHEDEGWVVTLPTVKPVVTVFDQPDELPTPVTATEGGDGELSGRRAQYQTNYLRWWQPDELQPSQTFEEDWQAPATRIAPHVMQLLVCQRRERPARCGAHGH